MEKWKELLLGGTALAGVGLMTMPADAQNAPAAGATGVTQTAFHGDASNVLAATSSTNCTTTQVATATLALTITPPAGQFVYVTGVYIEVAGNGTGSTGSTTAWTSTNLTNLPSYLVSAGGTASFATQQVAETYPPGGLKSLAAGTAVTLTPLATLASAFTCAKVTGYFSPL